MQTTNTLDIHIDVNKKKEKEVFVHKRGKHVANKS